MDHDFTPELVAHTDPAGATWLVAFTHIPEALQVSGKAVQWTAFDGYLQPVKSSLVSNTACAQDRSRRWLRKHWKDENIQPEPEPQTEEVGVWGANELGAQEAPVSPIRRLVDSIHKNLAKAA